MALSGPFSPARRGNARGPAFGYPIAPGEIIYQGGLICVNAAGQAQRLQSAGSVAFIGLAQNGYNNAGNSTAGPNIVGVCDDFAFPISGATAANITAPVYATDDNTLTLTQPTSGFQKIVGHLVGIDNGKTFVEFKGY